jgi:signal transduction histidine kinase/ligand-binding sensor domain-containing protein/DNA-binding response OmpR family regulator
MGKLSAFIFCFLFLHALGYSQVTFRRLSVQEGISNSSVIAITQDNDHFLWFGTRDGLNRFDGYSIQIFRKDRGNPNGLLFDDIRLLYFDPLLKTIWAGSTKGLSRFISEKNEFHNYHFNPTKVNDISEYYIQALLRDSKGNLWVGVPDGLYLFNATKDKFEKQSIKYQGNPLNILSIHEDKSKKIWIGTNAGLFQLKYGLNKQVNLEEVYIPEVPGVKPIKGQAIYAIQSDLHQQLWLGTHGEGLYKWHTLTNKMAQYKHIEKDSRSLSNNMIRSIAVHPNGQIWVGTFVGLNQFDPVRNNFKAIVADEKNQSNLSSSSIWSVFFDKKGSLWVGTFYGGVNFYDPGIKRFQNYVHIPERNSLSHNVVSAIKEDDKGNFWIGTEGGGLNYFEKGKQTFVNYFHSPLKKNALSGNNIKALYYEKNQLWIGTYNAGLDNYDVDKKSFTNYGKGERGWDKFSSLNVYSLLKIKNLIYVLTYGGGLNVLDIENKKITQIQHDPKNKESLSNNLGRILIRDKMGNVWIGTEDGLNLLSRENIDKGNYTFKRYLEGYNIASLYEDSKGNIWIGTFSNGLIYRNNQSFNYFTEKEGLAGHTIFTILEDKRGEIWLGTNQGISRCNVARKSFLNYNSSDGLQNLEFNYNAGLMDSKTGGLLFGGKNGFTWFQPSNLKTNKYIPKVALTRLIVNNREVKVGAKDGILSKALNQMDLITFKHNQANFTLQFSALDYLNPQKNHYAIKLEGLDKSWQYIVGSHEVTYTLQKPGSYLFRLKGGNNDGIWNPKEKVITIKVLPSPWLSLPAYLVYFSLFAIALFIGYRFIVLNHTLALEQVEKGKQSEIHQMKLRFFTNITHELRTPLSLILGPLEELLDSNKENKKNFGPLKTAHRNAVRLLHLVNQLLTFRKLERDHEEMNIEETDIISFLRDISDSFKDEIRLHHIDFKISYDFSPFPVFMDRDKMEKVFYNLLSNAFKFTPEGGNISIVIAKKGESVSCTFKDSGIGIEPEFQDEIFRRFYEKDNHHPSLRVQNEGTGIGLALSLQMVKLHKGEIKVESEPNKGASFEVTFPINLNLAAQEIIVKQSGTDTRKVEKTNEMKQSPSWEDWSEVQVASDSLLNTQSFHFLLIDDNEEIIDYLSTIFPPTIFLSRATDGKSGFEKALLLQPDLIISDVMMPGMDGFQLSYQLRANFETSHIPIILLTAQSDFSFKLEGLKTGADEYLTKPFHPKELFIRVENILRNRGFSRQKFKEKEILEPSEITFTSADETLIQNAIAVVEKNMDFPEYSVDQFAQDLAVSRPSLFNKMRALTGETPKNFIKIIRLKRAAQLLKTGKLSVSEVCYMTGFRDPKYFNKCFQKQYNQSPSEYKANFQ